MNQAAPAASRRMVQLWGNAEMTEEASRAELQDRVRVLFKVMFWSLIALTVFLAGTYHQHPADAPTDRALVYVAAGVGLFGMLVIWQGFLVRRPLSIRALYGIDLAYSFFIGLAFGLAAFWQSDLRPSGYLSVIYSTFTVFSRTLIVPSSWRRTLVASSLTYTPMTIAGLVLALTEPQDMPALMYFLGYLLFSIVPIIIATASSFIIYGLRAKVSAAQQLGMYMLDRKIGAGGMGTVYLAHHVLLRRPTAIKLVHPDRNNPELLHRFEREVQHTSQLTHPNNVAVYDYGHSLDGAFYYAMEYLGGGIDLDQLVRRHGPQPNARVIAILAQVCGALYEAHLKGLVHRDIKPANIILCERGGQPDIAKVVDYGLVRDIANDSGQTGQMVLGTPAYIAPEAITDPGSVGPGVDIYALGATGYFLLTGQPVFKGKTVVDVCVQHATKAVTPPSQVTTRAIAPALEQIILRCLAKTPGERFASAAELRAALLSLRPDPDWSRADAQAFWSTFRASSAAAAPSDTPTLTIDLDALRAKPA